MPARGYTKKSLRNKPNLRICAGFFAELASGLRTVISPDFGRGRAMTEREIFTAALTRGDPAERAAYLDQACSGDAALRQRIESLLAEHQELGSFMDVPPAEPTIDQPPAESAGTIIG